MKRNPLVSRMEWISAGGGTDIYRSTAELRATEELLSLGRQSSMGHNPEIKGTGGSSKTDSLYAAEEAKESLKQIKKWL